MGSGTRIRLWFIDKWVYDTQRFCFGVLGSQDEAEAKDVRNAGFSGSLQKLICPYLTRPEPQTLSFKVVLLNTVLFVEFFSFYTNL